MGHEYEVLSKYSEAYEEVKPSQEIQQTSGDYEFSQCPAYGATSAMAHSTPVVSGSDDKSGIVVGGEGAGTRRGEWTRWWRICKHTNMNNIILNCI